MTLMTVGLPAVGPHTSSPLYDFAPRDPAPVFAAWSVIPLTNEGRHIAEQYRSLKAKFRQSPCVPLAKG